MQGSEGGNVLLKLRTDVNATTPEMDRVLQNLPSWCSQYGKSTAPYTLAYFDTLYVASVADPSLKMATSSVSLETM